MNYYQQGIKWTPTTDVIYRKWLINRLQLMHNKSKRNTISLFTNDQLKKKLSKQESQVSYHHVQSTQNILTISPYYIPPTIKLTSINTKYGCATFDYDDAKSSPFYITNCHKRNNTYIVIGRDNNTFDREISKQHTIYANTGRLTKLLKHMEGKNKYLKEKSKFMPPHQIHSSLLKSRKIGIINRLRFI